MGICSQSIYFNEFQENHSTILLLVACLQQNALQSKERLKEEDHSQTQLIGRKKRYSGTVPCTDKYPLEFLMVDVPL